MASRIIAATLFALCLLDCDGGTPPVMDSSVEVCRVGTTSQCICSNGLQGVQECILASGRYTNCSCFTGIVDTGTHVDATRTDGIDSAPSDGSLDANPTE